MDYEEIIRLQNQKPISQSKKSIQNNRWNDAVIESSRYNALSSPELLIIVEIITENKNIGKLLSVKEIYKIFNEKVGENRLSERQLRNRLDTLEKIEMVKKVLKSDNMAYTIVEDFNFDNKALPQSQIAVFTGTIILCIFTSLYSIITNSHYEYMYASLILLVFILIQNLAMMIDYEFTVNDYQLFYEDKKQFLKIETIKEYFNKKDS